jgi:hypothetical protein
MDPGSLQVALTSDQPPEMLASPLALPLHSASIPAARLHRELHSLSSTKSEGLAAWMFAASNAFAGVCPGVLLVPVPGLRKAVFAGLAAGVC